MTSWLEAPGRRLILIAAGVTAFRLIAAGSIPLTEDEAYYQLWARHLQLGYYDHPPMIAWWIWLGERLAGPTSLGVRLAPVLGAGLSTWLVGDLARRLGAGERAAARAALWYNATFTIGLGGILATPDAPAAMFWALTLWMLADSRRNHILWLCIGIAAGLAALSKYSGLFLAPGVLLWLALDRAGRGQLTKPGPWIAALAAVAVFGLNVAWNAGNGWITFVKQFGRIEAEHFAPARTVEFLATQFVLLNPIIAVFMLLGVAAGLRGRGSPSGPELMLPILTSLPFAAYLLLHSLHDRVQGHWPAPLFAAAVVCAAVGAERAGRWGRAGRASAPLLGYGVLLAVLALTAAPGLSWGALRDPTAPLRGWPRFAQAVEASRRENGAAWVGVIEYGTLAQLAHAGRIRAPLLQIVERDRYRLETSQAPDMGRPGLVVDLSRRVSQPLLARCFREARPVEALIRTTPNDKNGRYVAYLVSGPRTDVWRQGCPKPQNDRPMAKP